ncbi:MAG: TonB-dependent receptor [Litoreibacter sp.]|nr:TonB-dependent receptor [Litoreibacter sp.]
MTHVLRHAGERVTKTRNLLITTTALTLCLPIQAFAQSAEGVELDELFIGESRRDVATDTAAPETTIDQEELDGRQATTFGELLDTVPNVTLLNGNTPQGGGVSIRGLGSQAGLYSTDGTVAVVIDGVTSGAEEIYRNGSVLALEPELFKEITVTRGPSGGFRYSSGASGGTIEATTKDASDFLEDGDTFAFRQKLGYETNGNSRLSTSIFAFAPDDKFEALLFYGFRDAREREDGNGNRLIGTEFKQTAGLAKFSYRLNPESKFTFSYLENTIPERDVLYNVFDGVVDAFFGRVDRDIDDTTAYLEYAYAPTDSNLIDLTARLQFKREDIKLDPVFNPFMTDLLEADHLTETTSFLVTNVSRFDTGSMNHELTVGVEIGERERSSLTDAGINDTAAPGGMDRYLAFYLVDEIAVTDRLTITPSLRYEHQELTSDNNPALADGTSFSDYSWTGGINAFYDINDRVSVFGTVAYNENMPLLDNITNANVNNTERATTLEFGASYEGFDIFTSEDSLSAKVTVYSTQIRSGRTYSLGGGTFASDVDLYGLELEASYVNPAFYVDLAAGINRGKVKGISNGTAANQDFNYTTADNIELTIGKVFMDEQLDVAFSIDHNFANDRTTTTSATSPLRASQSYTLFDVGVGYIPNQGALEGLEFRASIDNILDKNYRQFGSSRNGSGRNFKLTVAKTF